MYVAVPQGGSKPVATLRERFGSPLLEPLLTAAKYGAPLYGIIDTIDTIRSLPNGDFESPLLEGRGFLDTVLGSFRFPVMFYLV